MSNNKIDKRISNISKEAQTACACATFRSICQQTFIRAIHP